MPQTIMFSWNSTTGLGYIFTPPLPVSNGKDITILRKLEGGYFSDPWYWIWEDQSRHQNVMLFLFSTLLFLD